MFRSSHLRAFYKKGVATWPGLQSYQKRDSGEGVFPLNFVKFPRTSFLQNTSGDCFFNALVFCYSIHINEDYSFLGNTPKSHNFAR